MDCEKQEVKDKSFLAGHACFSAELHVVSKGQEKSLMMQKNQIIIDSG